MLGERGEHTRETAWGFLRKESCLLETLNVRVKSNHPGKNGTLSGAMGCKVSVQCLRIRSLSS